MAIKTSSRTNTQQDALLGRFLTLSLKKALPVNIQSLKTIVATFVKLKLGKQRLGLNIQSG